MNFLESKWKDGVGFLIESMEVRVLIRQSPKKRSIYNTNLMMVDSQTKINITMK